MSTVKEHLESGLYYRDWQSNKRTINGVIMIVHGLGEHCERYDALAEYCNSRGYHVASMDLPCHGKSDGPRGHVNSFNVFDDAVLGMYERITAHYPDVPVTLLGHSMGGLISARLLLKHQDKFNAAVLSGAAIKSPQEPPAWQVVVIRNLAKLFPALKVLELEADKVSRDPEVVRKYFADPLVSTEKLSAKFLVSMFEAMEDVKTQAEKITLPVFILHGGDDVMTDPEGSRLLFDSVSSKKKDLKIYQGLYHEIFNEPEAPEIYKEVIDWLSKSSKSKA